MQSQTYKDTPYLLMELFHPLNTQKITNFYIHNIIHIKTIKTTDNFTWDFADIIWNYKIIYFFLYFNLSYFWIGTHFL